MSRTHIRDTHKYSKCRSVAIRGLAVVALCTTSSVAFSGESAQGLCHPPLTITGHDFNNPVYHLGRSVAGAGDVDGDGVGDIIVGGWDLPPSQNIVNPGTVRIYSGSTHEILYEFLGKERRSLYDYGEGLGVSVDAVGDINGDGYADVIAGAPHSFLGRWYEPGGFAGRAIVFSGLDGDTLFVFHGAENDDELGISVAGAGDVNADGVPDMIVGAWQEGQHSSQHGKAYVFSGVDGDTLYVFAEDVLPAGGSSEELGGSVDGAGDVNGDGYDDLIVGARGAGADRAGQAYVFSGQDGSLLYAYEGEARKHDFGYSVSGAGDVNRDGFSDFIIGARFYRDGGDWDVEDWATGRAYVYSGRDGSLLYAPMGGGWGDRFGESVSGAGDVDGDGYDDFIVGAPQRGKVHAVGPGYSEIFSGANGTLLFRLDGETDRDWFGNAIAGLGDLNNDGTPEIGICATAFDGRVSDMGRVYVHSLCAQEIDILPQECPNELAMIRRARRRYEPMAARAGEPIVSVAIRGTPYFVVSDVDTSTILFAGVAPVRLRYAHVSTTPFQNETHCACSIDTADGQIDLVVDFNRDEVIAALGEAFAGGDRQRVALTAHLRGGGLIVGSDCLEVIPDRGLPASAAPSEEIATTTLRSNTPNPFNASTVIAFTLGEPGPVRLEVFDILGRHVITLADDYLPAGEHQVTWDGNNSSGNPAASGIYFSRLTSGSGVVTRKMALLK